MVALFLEDWEPGRVAFSCQEMRDACWDSSESLGSPCSLRSVRKAPLRKSGRVGMESQQLSQPTKAFLSQWTGCNSEGEGCGESKERRSVSGQAEIFERRSESEWLERSLRILLSLIWPFINLSMLLQFKHFVLPSK